MEMTEKHKKELEDLKNQMVEEAKKVRQDYVRNPSQLSGSFIHFHENSPHLNPIRDSHIKKTIEIDDKKININPDSKEKA